MEQEQIKKYNIDSFEKLINVVTTENVGRLALDLALFLQYAATMYEEFRKQDPKGCEGKTNWEIGNVSFEWADDNKNELKYVKVEDKSTGEVTHIDLKK